MKLSSYKLPQPTTPFDLFTSGYILNVFPCADENCVSRFISSSIRNAEFLLSDIWKELQVNRAGGVWASHPENQPAAEGRGRLPPVYPFCFIDCEELASKQPSVWAASIPG